MGDGLVLFRMQFIDKYYIADDASFLMTFLLEMVITRISTFDGR